MQLNSVLVPALPITFNEMQEAAPIVRARLDGITRVGAADVATLKTNQARIEYWQLVASWALKNHDEVSGRIDGAEMKAMSAGGTVNAGTAG